jgi:hypothetical protein
MFEAQQGWRRKNQGDDREPPWSRRGRAVADDLGNEPVDDATSQPTQHDRHDRHREQSEPEDVLGEQ